MSATGESMDKRKRARRHCSSGPSQGVGLVVVTGALGLLLYKAIWREVSPPEVTVRVISVVPVQNGILSPAPCR